MNVRAGGVSPTAPDETDLAQALFHTLYDAGVSFKSGDLIPRLTATVRALGYRHMPEVTAPDEREALFRLIYGYETIDFRESQNFTTRDCYGVVDAILAAGFRRSREATTEPTPEPEWEYTTAARDGGPSESRYRSWGSVDPRHAKFRRRKAGPWIPVEAVEASRSPKPTEHTDRSA